jgi:lycopene elongase/hydratase (dihydrobisanhydrobacterioruberin-forming)
MFSVYKINTAFDFGITFKPGRIQLIDMENMSVLLKLSRPFLWALGPMVFLIGHAVSGLSSIGVFEALQLALLSFPFCVLMYGVNGIYDYKSDSINPRRDLIEGVTLKPKYHGFVKRASMAAALALVLSSIATGNISNMIGMGMLIAFTYMYSVPPIRLKVRPPLDSFSNGIIYFLAPLVIGYSFGGSFLSMPLKWYMVSACVMGVHSYTTIMDYGSDKKVGDRTFSVAFGKRTAALLALIIFILTGMLTEVSPIEQYFIAFCSVLFAITAIFPKESLAKFFLKLIFAGFIISTAIFLSQTL